MAARQRVVDFDQVFELVVESSDDAENDENNVSEPQLNNEEAIIQTLGSVLNDLEGGPAFNKTFFRDLAQEMLTPLVHISWKEPRETSDMEAFRLLSSSFCFLPVIRRESMHWLNAIYRRLTCKKRIRCPYFAEIRRDIPYGFFNIVLRVVRNVKEPEFSPPHCLYAKDKAAEVISFTTRHSAAKLFVLLSGKGKEVVDGYYKVKLLVSDGKDFGFLYNFKKEQLIIFFNFGEWNVHGFPQHN